MDLRKVKGKVCVRSGKHTFAYMCDELPRRWFFVFVFPFLLLLLRLPGQPAKIQRQQQQKQDDAMGTDFGFGRFLEAVHTDALANSRGRGCVCATAQGGRRSVRGGASFALALIPTASAGWRSSAYTMPTRRQAVRRVGWLGLAIFQL